jgi:hypothetical protein
MEFDEKDVRQKFNEISLNTLCSAIHAFALFNYRSQPFISYFIAVFEMLTNTKKLTAKLHNSKIDENTAKKLIHFD